MKYQTQASPTITHTTTRLITVSWNIAYGKNGFPVALDVLLVALVLRAPLLDPAASHPRCLRAGRAGRGPRARRVGSRLLGPVAARRLGATTAAR